MHTRAGLALLFLAAVALVEAGVDIPTVENYQAKEALRFKDDGTFNVLQFTDMHTGEHDDLDAKTARIMSKILEAEKPDVVVITGDAVSGYGWDHKQQDFFKGRWEVYTKPMSDANVRWAYVNGNHDTQGDLDGDEIVELDVSSPLSYTVRGPTDIHGTTNYVLPVLGHGSSTDPALNLFLFDSTSDDCLGQSGWGCVYPDQVAWYRDITSRLRQSQGAKVPGAAFFHIPLPEFMNMLNNDYGKPVGNWTEDVCCFSVNTGLFSAMLEEGNIQSVHVGHDHNNDASGAFGGIRLMYGRKTGYGGYGPPDGWLRGARVLKFQEGKGLVDTWIRQEDGSISRDPPPTPKRDYQQICCGAEGGVTSKEEPWRAQYLKSVGRANEI